MTTFPLTTTLQRVHANCMPVPCRLDNALRKLENSPTHDTPIFYAQILDTLGLDYALICCRAEPQHEQLWRSYVAWCFDRAGVQNHAIPTAGIKKISSAANAVASKLASNAEKSVSASLSQTPNLAARVQKEVYAITWNEAWDEERQAQADAFRQLVTTGTLP